MKTLFIVLASLLISTTAYSENVKIFLSEKYSRVLTLDQVYKSMNGPRDNIKFKFNDNATAPELLWITSAKVDVFSPDQNKIMSPEYLCHSHLKFDTRGYPKSSFMKTLFRKQSYQYYPKLFTLIQGQANIKFPKGFGIPVLENDPFIFHGMVINPNETEPQLNVKLKPSFEYVKNSELKNPLTPLYRIGAEIKLPTKIKSLNGGSHRHLNFSEKYASNKIVKPAPSNLKNNYSNYSNRVMHWQVPPGTHTYNYVIDDNRFFYIKEDTTVHYIAAHLHPFGRSLELRDLTENKTIFKSVAKNFVDRIGIESISYFSSELGIPIYKDHQYELIAVYENKTSNPIDAMAIMYLYLYDKKMDRYLQSIKKNS